MLLECMLAVVLNMVNRYKYLPELIVVHIGASDFSSHQSSNQDQHPKYGVKLQENHHSSMQEHRLILRLMFLLMLSLPFYINWDSQRAAQRARAHFNRSLAKCAQKNGGYIIRHLDIVTVTDPGLYNPNNQGDLTKIGYLLMMKDIAQRVQIIVTPFMVALTQRRQPMAMHNAIQAAHRRD